MRLNRNDPFASYYTVTVPQDPIDNIDMRCDQTRTIGNAVLCESTMTLMSLLRRLSHPKDNGLTEATSEDQTSQNPGHPLHTRPPVLAELAGRRALILGDSVERYMLLTLQDEVLKDTRYFRQCDMDDSKVLYKYDWEQGPPRMMVIPVMPSGANGTERFDFARDVDVNHSPSMQEYGSTEAATRSPADVEKRARSQVRLDFMHMYGTDDDDLWEDRNSHFQATAWRSKDRIDKVGTMWGTEPDTYDTIFINFGLWELARYQRTAYILHSADEEIGLPQEWLEDYKHRIRMYVERLQKTWSQAKVVIRTIHDPRENAGGWFRSSDMNAGGVKKAPFTRLRVNQLRRAQIQVARDLGLDVLNWADHMIGQHESWLQDEVHPAVPGALILAEMYLRMLAGTGGGVLQHY